MFVMYITSGRINSFGFIGHTITAQLYALQTIFSSTVPWLSSVALCHIAMWSMRECWHTGCNVISEIMLTYRVQCDQWENVDIPGAMWSVRECWHTGCNVISEIILTYRVQCDQWDNLDIPGAMWSVRECWHTRCNVISERMLTYLDVWHFSSSYVQLIYKDHVRPSD